VACQHRAFGTVACFDRESPHAQDIGLTRREVEVLKWTADGKSAQEIADILNVTKHVVDFHIKNAIYKLKTANKTAAVVKAAMLGLLN